MRDPQPFGAQPAVPALGEQQGKTVCGLTIWNVSPDLDPRMVLRPKDNRLDYKIEKLVPPVCTE